jgi:hypothetical protein
MAPDTPFVFLAAPRDRVKHGEAVDAIDLLTS